MSAPHVFVTRVLPGPALGTLGQKVDLTVWTEPRPVPRDRLLEEAARSAGLLTLLTERIDTDLLDHAPALKVVSNMAVGFDNIDVPACAARNIPVGHTPGVLTDTTADFAFALLLAASRRLVEADLFVREGKWRTWDPNLFLGQDVYGMTLGIVGFGLIGRAVARRAEGFGMRVLYASRSEVPPEVAHGAQPASLDEVLAESDFVSLHVPLTESTRNLISEPELRRMKNTAFLINTARGKVVEQTALGRALREGWIAGAALDVTDPEPLPADHPLLSAPNLVICPHIASGSLATRSRMAQMAVDNLLAGLDGQPLPNAVPASRLREG